MRGTPAVVPPGLDPGYALMYASVEGERFPVPAADLAKINPAFLRSEVAYPTPEPPGTIVVDPAARYLYFIEEGGMATRYGVGVGKEGFGWSGVATINSKQEWPDWYPPPEMIARRPDIEKQLVELQSGKGVAGGLEESDRRARHVSVAGQQGHAFPHPRDDRAADDRPERFFRLHPHDQPGRHPPLRPRRRRNAGEGASGQDGLSHDPQGDRSAAPAACGVLRFRLGGNA